MARGKRSRALFEVIKQSQELQSRKARSAAPPIERSVGAAPLSTTIVNWFRRRPKDAPPVPPSTFVSGSFEPVMRELTPPAPEPTEAASDEPREAAAETSSDRDGATGHDAPYTRVFLDEDPPSEASSGSPHDTAITTAITSTEEPAPIDTAAESVDSGGTDDLDAPSVEREATTARHTVTPRTSPHNQVTFVLSYPSIAISLVAAALLLTVAFLAGRHSRSPWTGPTLADLQAGKPTPAVMDLGKSGPVLSAPTAAAPDQQVRSQASEAAKAVRSKESVQEKPSAPEANADAPLTVPSADRRRVVGRNYIIAQSYPDPDNAEKAAAVLRKANIPVTVEQLDYAPGWYCVVTEVGFDRVSVPDCERYQKLIRDCNNQARASRVRFEPYLYKWK